MLGLKPYLKHLFRAGEVEVVTPDDKAIVDAVQDALIEWQNAQYLFEYAVEPEMVDYAIFQMDSSRRKYEYLVSLAKKQGVLNKNYAAQHIQQQKRLIAI
jgi:hypothetical protein